MVSEGMILADRYQIIGKIGTGGMSDVYKAKDFKLSRFVAIKVLKSEFSESKNFVTKFRIEAQSAASLMHPNIVNVYDVGDENGLYYIVMELVEGITLKKYIEKKLRLSVNEAISIAIQVSMGIQSAHSNHIIHRDIKPQNIIISKDGKVKVTDFGIARAATSNTITSNAMGSVHYTSPEQARGGYSDEKSDIYSLGITMYEMLTGRVPFDGETTVAIAIKHIQEELPSPRDYVDDIPVSVEQIIYKCCQKNAARRYQDMDELIVDLKKSLITPDEDFVKIVDLEAKGETRHVTRNEIEKIKQETGHIPVMEEVDVLPTGHPRKTNPSKSYPDEDIFEPEDGYYDPDGEYDMDGFDQEEIYDPYDEDQDMPEYLREELEEDTEYINRGRRRTKKELPNKRRRPATERGSEEKRRKERERKERERIEKERQEKEKNRRKPKKPVHDDRDDEELDPGIEKLMNILGVIVALMIVGLVVFAVIIVMKGFERKPESGKDSGYTNEAKVLMPEVTGMSEAEAKEALYTLGLEVRSNYKSSPSVEQGQVMSQSVEPGESIDPGTEIELTVSSGKEGLVAPDVVGLSEAEAKVKIESEGLVMVKDESPSDEVEKGNVITQNPGAGDSISKGGTITVIISTGASEEGTVEVPDVRNQEFDAAASKLEEMGLKYAVVEEFSETVPAGIVISQSYAPNVPVNKGTEIVLNISKGLDPENSVKYYKCNLKVNAPVAYAGGIAKVSLKQNDTGKVIFETNTTNFPVEIALTSVLGSPETTLTIEYSIEKVVQTENEDGTVNSYASTEVKKETQAVMLDPQQ